MEGVRAELLLLLVVTGTLLLVPVWSWEPIDDAQLEAYYETGEWAEPQSGTSVVTISEDDSSDLDGEESLPEDVVPEAEAPSSETVNPFGNSGFQVEFDDFPSTAGGSTDSDEVEFIAGSPGNMDRGTDDGYQVDFGGGAPEIGESGTDGFDIFLDAPPRSWSSSSSPSSSGLNVVCSDVGFRITPLTGSLSDVKVLGSKELLLVSEAPDYCGYEVDPFRNTLTVPFTGCNVKYADGYSLQLLYADEFGQTQIATASCKGNQEFDPDQLFPRSTGKLKPTAKKCNPSPSPPLNCGVKSEEQVSCGHAGISSAECEKLGCCVDASACYYPLDECTGDQHFVFAIRPDSASITVDPTKLVIPGSPNCKPIIVNDKVAIFKFRVTECGARSYNVGETKVYLAEVQTVVKALNLKYGIITRTDPLRFMVECRYSKTGEAQQSLASVGYMVKTTSPVLPTSVMANGLYGVQLRIAEDNTYSKYLPVNNQPLRLLLGKPVYLELRLKSPKPDAVIVVNYCIAYPRSAKNALVLVYEGCANPNDPNVSILKVSDLPQNRHQRRFMVQAFQFMDQKTNKYLNEEIYFMCSAEVCRPTEKNCEERCSDGKTP